MKKKILFLGYSRNETSLIEALEGRGFDVVSTPEVVTCLSDYHFVISYGYRHIISTECLATARRPVLNLHISYLPWGKGAHPLFWAAYEGSISGVTIHEIDSGIDTGPICFQEQVEVDYCEETFVSGYQILRASIERMFLDNLDKIASGDYVSRPQDKHAGSFHRVRDLPSGFSWSDRISDTVQRLRSNRDNI